MNAVAGVFSGLHGALLLARGRAEGVRYVSDDMRMAARSFWAALICSPLFIVVLLLSWKVDGQPGNPPHAFVLQLLSFAIGWAGYAVLSHPLVAAFRRAPHWPRFIAIWNWCNVVQYGLLLIASIPAVLGAPSWLAETAQLVAQGWALWLEWFAIRLTLDVGGLTAAIVMAPDVLLGVVLATLVTGA
ncbi:MAG TPA: hypothetical protein VIZ17_11865 [Acetobacteraceae bacterium]